MKKLLFSSGCGLPFGYPLPKQGVPGGGAETFLNPAVTSASRSSTPIKKYFFHINFRPSLDFRPNFVILTA